MIALNVSQAKGEIIYRAYVSQYNLNSDKQVIHLMILNGEGWYYFAVKNDLHY